MPPLRPCLDCQTLTTRPTCPTCTTNRNRTRGSATQRGYDREYQAFRITILNRDNWTCHICGKHLVGSDATVDHLLPLSSHPHLRLDPTNARACCRSDNSAKRDR